MILVALLALACTVAALQRCRVCSLAAPSGGQCSLVHGCAELQTQACCTARALAS